MPDLQERNALATIETLERYQEDVSGIQDGYQRLQGDVVQMRQEILELKQQLAIFITTRGTGPNME